MNALTSPSPTPSPTPDEKRAALALVEGVRRYVFSIARRRCYGWTDEDREEAIADALYAAYRAALRFDPERGVKPITYVGGAARDTIRRAWYVKRGKQSVFENVVLSGNTPTNEGQYGPNGDLTDYSIFEDLGCRDTSFEEVEARLMCEEAFERTPLSTQERTTLERRLDGATYDEIGAQFGVSRQRVEQVMRKALAKVREALDIQVVNTHNTKRQPKCSKSEVPQ